MEEIIETVDLCSSQQEEEKCWPEPRDIHQKMKQKGPLLRLKAAKKKPGQEFG